MATRSTAARKGMYAALAGAAAVVLVIILMRTGGDAVPGSDENVVAPFECEIVALESGEYRLDWLAVDGAVSYQVAIYGSDHRELARVGVGRAHSITMETPPGTAFCRVIALRGGDEIAGSAPVYLPER